MISESRSDKEWEKDLIDSMQSGGWKCDVNTEEKLGFVFDEDEQHEWIREYNKKTRNFIQFNGRQIINIRVKS